MHIPENTNRFWIYVPRKVMGPVLTDNNFVLIIYFWAAKGPDKILRAYKLGPK